MTTTLHRLSLRKLQHDIQELCGFSVYDQKETLLFNLPFDMIIANNFYDTYINFLNFCLDSIKDFTKNNTNDIYASYSVPGINENELLKFKSIVENYSKKYNTDIKHKYTLSKKYPNDKQLFAFNETVLDQVIDPIRFNAKFESYIWGILNDRVKELNTCMDKIDNTSRKIKSKPVHAYYLQAYNRELQLIKDIEKKIQKGELIPPEDVLYQDLSEEDKNKTSIGYMADKIQFGPNTMFIFDKPNIDEVIDELIKDIVSIKNGGQYGHDPLIIKKLMTFLPLELFNISDGTDEYSINNEQFKTFLKKEGQKNKNNFQQYRLGLGDDLFRDELNSFKSTKQELWHTFILIGDPYNKCGNFIDYNIYLNLFAIYMYGRSNKRVFPISFSLANNTTFGFYDEKTKSYSFRTRKPYSAKQIFNPDIKEPQLKFIGIHLIKYYKNNKLCLLPLTSFIDKNFDTKRMRDINAFSPSIISSADSIYNGSRREIYNLNSKFFFSEPGEISSEMNITHHELYNVMYYKLRFYIIDDNRKELFLTMKPRNDPDLIKLMSVLNMKEVFIMKNKFDDIYGPQRIIIVTLDEIKSETEKGSYIICNQLVPTSGGSLKIKRKSKFKNKIKSRSKHKLKTKLKNN